MNIKTKIRIIKIFFAGHYRLIKAIRRRKGRDFIKNLQILTPTYCKDYVGKYGNEEFTWWVDQLGRMEEHGSRKFHYFETKTGELKTTTDPLPPVTIQITKDNFNQS